MSGSPYRLDRHSAPQAAQDSTLVAAVAHIFSHSFGTNPKTGQPYRLGPKTTRERLQGTTDLIIGIDDSTDSAMGYIYGRTIESPHGLAVWIDSLAVEPEHRRKSPPHPSEPPPWWSSLAHLPSEHEALLVIDRHATV